MHSRRVSLLTLAGAVVALAAAPGDAAAQSFGGRLRQAAADAAKRRVEERVESTAGRATDAALDGAESRAKVSAKAGAKAGATAGAKAGATTGATHARRPDASADTVPAARSANAGADFTPGTRVLFATDFAGDAIGDFPRALRLHGGNAEVAEIGGTRYLRATDFGTFEIPLPVTLPERFTMEFDFTGAGGWYQHLYFTGDESDDAYFVSLRPTDGGIAGPNDYRVASDAPGTREGVPFRVQIMADGDYVKVYMNGTRVANAPNARLGRSRSVRVKVSAEQESPMLLGNLRIAAGGKDLYAALESSGRVTAEGILFDTGSDRLRPESAPVLKEIADMLAAHPALRLSIEGHTDDVGGAAANLALSEQRAAAVRHHLVTELGADAARLQTRGFGATRPVADGSDAAARQRNRRVELVKQP